VPAQQNPATTGDVLWSVTGDVATVTLNRPEVYNAQTPQMWAQLREIGRELAGDVRVVVVRGAGRGFSAGLDTAVLAGSGPGDPGLLGLAELPADQCADVIAEFQQAFDWLRRPDLLSVAAVQGHAVGAGFQLALACDLRIVADDAQFTMAETSLGLVPDLGGTKHLVELVGYSHALEICVTGRRVGAAEAYRLGLATLSVPLAELDTATGDLVAALRAAPRAASIETKALLRAAVGNDMPGQLAAEREAQVRRIADLAGRGE
jgi:enoyl-CoA hydratase/carnithine racemase